MGVPDPTPGKSEQGVSQVHFETSSSTSSSTTILIVEEDNHVSSRLTATPGTCLILRPNQAYSPTSAGMVSQIKAGNFSFIWLELPRGNYSVTSRKYRTAMTTLTNWYTTAKAARVPCVMIGWLSHMTKHDDVKHTFTQILDDQQHGLQRAAL